MLFLLTCSLFMQTPTSDFLFVSCRELCVVVVVFSFFWDMLLLLWLLLAFYCPSVVRGFSLSPASSSFMSMCRMHGFDVYLCFLKLSFPGCLQDQRWFSVTIPDDMRNHQKLSFPEYSLILSQSFFFTSVYIASLLLHPVLFLGVLIITVIAIFMILSGDINIFTTLKFLLPVFMLPVSTLCHRMWKGKWAFSIRTKAVSLTWPSPCLALAVVLVLGFWTSLSVFRFPGNPSKVIIVKHGTGSVH